MIQVHSAYGMFYDRVALDFSDEDKRRIHEILNELKEIFRAESVGIHGEMSNGLFVDYVIDITHCPATNVYKSMRGGMTNER